MMRAGFAQLAWWAAVMALVLWAGSAHAGRLGRFVPLASPYGEFTMLVPEGWTFVPGAEENPVIVAPRGRLTPSLAIAVLNASAPLQLQMIQLFMNPTPDLNRCFVQAGLSGNYACLGPYYERFEPRLSADAASRILLAAWQQQGARLLDVRIQPLRIDRAVAVARIGRRGTVLEEAGLVQTIPLPDLSLRGLPGLESVRAYITYAVVAGCEAPAGQMAQVLPLCHASLLSFHNLRWPVRWVLQQLQENERTLSQITQGALNTLEMSRRRTQMIAEFGSTMRAMQYDTYMQVVSQNYLAGEKAIAALGGQTVLRHPSSGELYMAPADYRYYCLSSSGTVWYTNDDLAFRSRCSAPLRPLGP
jgi:hypothetical protein